MNVKVFGEESAVSAYAAMFVGVRLIAVYLFAVMVQQFLLAASHVFRSSVDVSFSSVDASFVIGLVVVGVMVSAALWFSASGLAHFATRSIPEQEKTPPMELFQIQRIALTVLGLWIVAVTAPYIPAVVIPVIQNMTSEQPVRQSLWEGRNFMLFSHAIKLLIGVILILGAGFWSRVLLKLQEFGLAGKRA